MLRAKQLIVIAGPSCAGKTFLLQRIRQGQCDSLCRQLGIADPSSCPQFQAAELEDLNEAVFETALVHFDFYSQDILTGGYQTLSELLDASDRATILTLFAPSESLVNRNHQRLRKAIGECLTSLLMNPKMLDRRIRLIRWLLKRRSFYKDRSALAAMYQKWAEFVDNCDVTHFWLESGDANTSATDAASVALADDCWQARTISARQPHFPRACHVRSHFGG
jgi:hypothetical protein